MSGAMLLPTKFKKENRQHLKDMFKVPGLMKNKKHCCFMFMSCEETLSNDMFKAMTQEQCLSAVHT